MINPLRRLFRKRKYVAKKVSDLSIGDCVVYPTGAGEVTSFVDEKRIEATGSLNIRFFKMDMISGPHKGDHLRDGLPWEDTIEVFKKEKPRKMFTVADAFAYTTCAFIFGSSVTALSQWIT